MKVNKQMKGNAEVPRPHAHTETCSSACGPLTLAVFASVVYFCMFSACAQVQLAALELRQNKRQEEEPQKIVEQKRKGLAELQAEKQRLEDQRDAMGSKPARNASTQMSSGGLPTRAQRPHSEGTVLVELKLSCPVLGSMLEKKPSLLSVHRSSGHSFDLATAAEFRDNSLPANNEYPEPAIPKPTNVCKLKAVSKKCLTKVVEAFTLRSAGNRSSTSICPAKPSTDIKLPAGRRSMFASRMGCCLQPQVNE